MWSASSTRAVFSTVHSGRLAARDARRWVPADAGARTVTVISETRERFLRAITGVIPAERVIEIHFFAPIRQGGVESGVAVIAAAMEQDPAADSAAADDATPKSNVVDDTPVALGSVVYADRAPEDEAGDLLEDGLPAALLAHGVDARASDVAEDEEREPAPEPTAPRYT